MEDDIGTAKKVKELSIIDGRRAQNCNILLSRYRLDKTTTVIIINCILKAPFKVPKDTVQIKCIESIKVQTLSLAVTHVIR